MNRSHLLLGLLLASSSLSLFACASPTDDGENADATESDVKKKVKPKGGNGAFDLVAPGFNATGFVGTFTFAGAPIKAGDRSEKVPGTYVLQSNVGYFGDGYLMYQQLSNVITAGTIVQHKLGGLRVRFAEPVTLGGTQVVLAPEGGSGGYLSPGMLWQTVATGASLLALAGKITVTPNTEATGKDVVITQGALSDVVLPVSHVAITLDAYDASYPTPTNCTSTSVRGGASTASAPVRNVDGSPNATFVVPQGTRAPVGVNAYGVDLVQPTVAGGTNSFTLNRLEVDDVEVAQAGGGTTMVKGTATISHKNADGTFTQLNCTFNTHSGLDLPDGTYRIVSRAQSASGVVTSTDDVTFP